MLQTVLQQTSAKDNVYTITNIIIYSKKFVLKYDGAPVGFGTDKMFHIEDGRLAYIPGRHHQHQEPHLQLL